jgi:hypothetical protein
MRGLTEKESIRALMASVVRQTLEDWEALDYGRLKCRRVHSNTVYRDELVSFIKSEEFAQMCEFAVGVPRRKIAGILTFQSVGNGKARLTSNEKCTLTSLKENNTNISATAVALGITRKIVYQRLQSIEAKTGKDPTNYNDLNDLLNTI